MKRLHPMLKESREQAENKTILPEAPSTSSATVQRQSMPPISMTSIFSITSSTNNFNLKKPPLCPKKFPKFARPQETISSSFRLD